MKTAVSISLGDTHRIRFPSVLLQPLGHLSVQVESTVYREAETRNRRLSRDCDVSGSDSSTRAAIPPSLGNDELSPGPMMIQGDH